MTAQVYEFPASRMVDAVLTKKQLASYLKCSTKTIDRRTKEGMPSFMLGAQRRYRLKDVMEWLEEQ